MLAEAVRGIFCVFGWADTLRRPFFRRMIQAFRVRDRMYPCVDVERARCVLDFDFFFCVLKTLAIEVYYLHFVYCK